MRNPNGYGTCYKLSGNRRNPYIVRKFERWEIEDGKKKAIYSTIGYAHTRKEGLEMLAKYNANPYDLKGNTFTFKEMFELFKEDKFPKISESNCHAYNAAFVACQPIHDEKFIELRHHDLQNVIDTSTKNYPTLKKIATLFNQMYKFAIINEFCTNDYSKHVSVAHLKDRNPNKYERTIFSKEDFSLLWQNSHNPYIQVILILLYTGSRVSPILDLKKCDVHLDVACPYIHIAKDKNESSIRDIPICDVILPIIKEWCERSKCDYLVCTPNNQHFLYRNYYDSYFLKILDEFGISKHKPHDTRKTTSTLLEQSKVPLLHRKLLLGHEIKDITEKVYTHVPLEELMEDINKIHEQAMK